MSHSPGCATTADEWDGSELLSEADLMDLGTVNEDLGENLELWYDMDEADPAHDVPMAHASEEHEHCTAVGGFGDNARVDGVLNLADLPGEILVEILVIVATMFGNPLALLVSKAHLSKSFRSATRVALAMLKRADFREWSRTVDDAAVAAVISTSLSSLDLSGCKITDATVVAVALGCPHLESFDLEGCKMITNAAVVQLASLCKKLASLNLRNSYCGEFSDTDVEALVSGCPQLVSLDLGDSENFTDAAVVALASRCKKLVSLNLNSGAGNYHITVKAVVLLASQCKQLKSLGLNSCYNITDEAVAAVASWCSQLESLDLGHCRHITDAAAVALASGCKRLTSLNLRYCGSITSAAVQALGSGCPQLVSLHLSGTT